MDIKEIAEKIRIEVLEEFGYQHRYTQEESIIKQGQERLISAYKTELLKEVGEPVAWLCWLDGDTELLLRDAALVRYEPLAYRNRRPLYTSDQVAAAILKATKKTEEENEMLRADLDTHTQDQVLIHEFSVKLQSAQEENESVQQEHRQWVADLQIQLAKAEQRVAEACAYLAHQHMDADIAADAINNGEWRKFVKEV